MTPSHRRLELTVPLLPPSENRIRVHRWQGGQVYSKEAKEFKRGFTDYVREHYFVDLQQFALGHTPQAAYSLDIIFSFDTPLYNKGWIKNAAKTLYKRVDVGNRRKLLEDCLVETIGIDDSLFFEMHLRKVTGFEAGVTMLIEEVDPTDYGIPEEYVLHERRK